MAQRRSRKRAGGKRKARGPAPAAKQAPPRAEQPAAGGYARSRAKDDAARAALEPLGPGERPRAVTVGAVAAAIIAVVQLVVLVLSFDSDEPGKGILGLIGIALMAAVAVGMWRARYWAVLGMQTLLALAIISSAIALVGAKLWAVPLLAAMIAAAGTLFWFLVRAMARIQMPQRPGATSRSR